MSVPGNWLRYQLLARTLIKKIKYYIFVDFMKRCKFAFARHSCLSQLPDTDGNCHELLPAARCLILFPVADDQNALLRKVKVTADGAIHIGE